MKLPVVSAFAVALPLMVPKSALEMTATFAGPPRVCPATPMAKSVKNPPKPTACMIRPKMMNSGIKVAEMPSASPNTPSSVRY